MTDALAAVPVGPLSDLAARTQRKCLEGLENGLKCENRSRPRASEIVFMTSQRGSMYSTKRKEPSTTKVEREAETCLRQKIL